MSAFMWPVYVDSLSLRMCANYIIARLWLRRIIWRTRSRESSNGLCLGLPPVHISLDKKLNASYPGGIRRPWLNVCAACACMSACNLCVCVEEESTTVNTFLIWSGFNINGNHIMTRLQKKKLPEPISFFSVLLQQPAAKTDRVTQGCYGALSSLHLDGVCWKRGAIFNDKKWKTRTRNCNGARHRQKNISQ